MLKYRINFCGELKKPTSERRLLIYKHENLLIALDDLERSLHHKSSASKFIKTDGRKLILDSYLPQNDSPIAKIKQTNVVVVMIV